MEQSALVSNPKKHEELQVSEKPTLIKVLSILVAVIGVVFLAVGVTMYSITSVQLKHQQVTVADYNEGSNHVANGSFAGKTVADPFTALAQITAISHHMSQASQRATGGTTDATTGVVTGGDPSLTYGTTPMLTLTADGTCASAVKWTDPAGKGSIQCAAKSAPTVTGSIVPAALASLRPTLQTGSFLIASLYVSVLAFGVSALVGGLGIVLLIIAAVQLLTLRTTSGAAAGSAKVAATAAV